ncbi:hypothetical protein K461DRAFT_282597 [Myriangium duriaei CBS 260.36]|uniref:Uncharacterized protein n=1 Tax=Myriangium duriaei CBS 260.36 TaxID=1168546 RepID=A0A9P4IVD9_9PEZI|nr:hypothetical protein K461DRAFT_282597 [Myriangium duriaei CBS 260.36]
MGTMQEPVQRLLKGFCQIITNTLRLVEKVSWYYEFLNLVMPKKCATWCTATLASCEMQLHYLFVGGPTKCCHRIF